MNIAEFAIEKKIIMMLLIGILLFGGLYGFLNVGRLEDPDFTIREVRIFTPYPGATPQEVEEEVSDLIESAVQKIPQIDYVKSESTNDQSSVTAVFFQGISSEEYRQIYDELRRKIDDVKRFLPPGAGPSLVNDDFKDVFGIFYAITGKGFSEEELYQYAEKLQKELLLVRGVAKVDLWGVPEEVIYIEIPRARMVAMGISQNLLLQLIQNQNMVVQAGDVVVGDDRPQFRVTGNFDTLESIKDIRLPSRINNGAVQVSLGDVANIYRGYREPPRKILRFEGIPAIGVAVSAKTTENVVDVGKRLEDSLYTMRGQTPIGIEIETIFNQPDNVTVAVDNFLLSLVQALSIVIGLLMVFMGLRSGCIIGFMLLLIIAGTLLFMYIMDITLQRISLGALIIAMGMLVDNSIVITEGILVRMNKGEDVRRASSAIVKQTQWPLFAATVIAIFAFSAVGLSPDATGEYTKTLFWVIIISLMLSWFLAISVNPLICVWFMKEKENKKGQEAIKTGKITELIQKTLARFSSKKEGKITFAEWYKKSLGICIRHRWATVGAVMILLALAFFGVRLLTSGFFPQSGQRQFLVDYWLPEGSDFYKTAQDMGEIEKILLDKELYPEIRKLSAFIGASPPRFQLTFTPEFPNPRYGLFIVEVSNIDSLSDVITRMQNYLEESYPQAMAQVYRLQLGPGAKGLVTARFQGPDPDVLRRLSEQTKQIYFNTGNAFAIRDNWGERAKVVGVEIDERAMREVGITRPEINQVLHQGYRGFPVGLYREANRLMPIISRPPKGEREDPNSIRGLYVWSSATQQFISINQIVKNFSLDWEDTRIQRRDRKRTIEVKADPRKGEGSALHAQVRPAVETLELPPGYTLTWGGQYEDSNRAMDEGIAKTLPLAFLAMFLTIFVLWNKVKQPIIIFLTLPLSLIGVVLGLLLSGFPFSFMAMMGVLALFGMVIKNAIVLVDEFDLTLKKRTDRFDALIDASTTRIRPVMMAALSTVLGMIPLLSDIFFQGMAVVVMFGLTIASVITLIVVPVLYSIFFGIKAEENHTEISP